MLLACLYSGNCCRASKSDTIVREEWLRNPINVGEEANVLAANVEQAKDGALIQIKS